jgi:hypothetical protein
MKSNPAFTLDRFPEAIQALMSRIDNLEERLTQKEVVQLIKPVTRAELCRHFRVSVPTVVKWEKRNLIPSMNIGSAKRYDLAKVQKAIEDNNLI